MRALGGHDDGLLWCRFLFSEEGYAVDVTLLICLDRIHFTARPNVFLHVASLY